MNHVISQSVLIHSPDIGLLPVYFIVSVSCVVSLRLFNIIVVTLILISPLRPLSGLSHIHISATVGFSLSDDKALHCA